MSLFRCPLCAYFNVKFISVVGHIARAHACEGNFTVTCNKDSCAKTFSSFEAYTRHLYRNHNIACPGNNSGGSTQTSFDDHSQSCENGYASAGTSSDKEVQFDPGADQSDGTDGSFTTDHCDAPSTEKEKKLFLEEMKKSFVLFYLKMTEGFKLAHSTAEEILSLMKVLFSASLQIIGTELEEELQQLDVDKSASTVLDMLLHPDSLFDCIFSGIQTKHQTENYVKAHLPYTEVKEVELQKPGEKKKSLCYIPVQQLLQNLLTVTDTYDSVVEGPDERSGNMLTDFHDAHYLQEQQHQLLKDGHENTIFLLLYTDELELSNPLGAAVGKHKILVVYFSIVNLHARHRSKLGAIHLLLIVPYPNVVAFGLEVVLAPLIEDLNFLKCHGLQVGAENFGVSVVAIVGDNLSMHRLIGLSCSFSSGRVSRFCLARYEDLSKLTSVSQCVRRTALSHASHQAAFLVDPELGALYGITCRSPLTSLEGFDVTRQLPPDAMHDILEGGIAFVLKVVLSGLVKSGTVKKEDLNRVADFPYGIHDRKSKPVPISKRILTRSGTLKGTASQKWCLFRLFPQIFGDLVTEGDKHWQVYLLYREIVDIILAEQIPIDYIDYLQVQITEFLRLFAEQYPEDHLKPKLHYLLHYPEFIYLFGPPRRYWAMRFEAKHSYFKGVASKVKNFRNIGQTLAHRHQLLQAYELGSNPMNKGVQATGVEVVEIASLPDRAILPLELQGEQSLSSVKTALFNSYRYRVDDIFVIAVGDEGPVFGKVHALFVASGSLVVLAEKLETVELSRHRCSHLVVPSGNKLCMTPSFQFQYYPLDCYTHENYLEVVPHFAIFA